MSVTDDEKTWIIQWRIDTKTNNYEDWPGYGATPMTRNELFLALEECHSKWPQYEFRGHNIHASVARHQKSDYLTRVAKKEH